VNRAVFIGVSKVIGFASIMLHDCLEQLALLSHAIRSRNRTNREFFVTHSHAFSGTLRQRHVNHFCFFCECLE